MPVGPADRPASLAGLEGWAVLVAGRTRWNLVSSRAAPAAEPLASTWSYAARGADRGGVLTGDGAYALQLDQQSATAALPFAVATPGVAHSDGGLVALAGPTAEGIALLVYRQGAAPLRVVVPGRATSDLRVRVRGSSVALAWTEAASLRVALVDTATGSVSSRDAMPLGGRNRFTVTSLAPTADGAFLVAYGETHVHTGGRAHWVRLARWTPGGALTAAGGLPEEPNRSSALLEPLGERTLAAWLEGPLLAPAALKIGTLDRSLTVQGTPTTLSTEDVAASEPLLSAGSGWAWLSWIEGDRRLAAGLRCSVLPEPVESGLGGPPGCAGPQHCGGRRCVTTALGGPYGCTDETCCGADECSNGCRADADCPSCRPTCRRAAGADHGTCARP